MRRFSRSHGPPPNVTGCVVRHCALGSEALYEVLSAEEGADVVTLEVLSAPGLAPGTHVRMMGYAVAAMEAVEGASHGLHSSPIAV